MSMKAVFEGGTIHGGEVRVGGFKHAFVTLLATAVAANAAVEIRRVPRILDVTVLLEILERNGARVHQQDDAVVIDPRRLSQSLIHTELSRQIHGAIYLIPAFLARLGRVEFGSMGGCRIGDTTQEGSRPVGHVIEVMKRYGARFRHRDGYMVGETDGLVGTTVDIRGFSTSPHGLAGPHCSGATKTAMIAACNATGPSEIIKPYRKIDAVVPLDLLHQLGFAVHRGADVVSIVAPQCRNHDGISMELPPDLAEIVTYIAAAVHLKVPITLPSVSRELCESAFWAELELLHRIGVEYTWQNDGLVVRGDRTRVRPIDIDVTCESIYSDHQPFFALMLLSAPGSSRIRDEVWKDRFDYASKLRILGARMTVPNRGTLQIDQSVLSADAVELHATDLRAAAALSLALIGVHGRNSLTGIEHLHRGYESFFPTLQRLGAEIKVLESADEAEVHDRTD